MMRNLTVLIMKKIFLLYIVFPAMLWAAVVKDITVNGLRLHREETVRNSIELAVGQSFTDLDLQQSVRNLDRLDLFSKIAIIEKQRQNDSVSLAVELTEFPRCEALEIDKNREFDDDELLEHITVSVNAIAHDRTLHRSKVALRKFYEQEGYPLADVQVERIPTTIPGNVLIKFIIDEGPRSSIETIRFVGNTHFSEGKLKRKFKTKEDRFWRGGEFVEKEYRQNLDSLVLFFQNEGFLDAKIVSDTVIVKPNRKDIELVITVDEGQQYYVGNLFFQGNTVFEEPQLQSLLKISYGDVYEYDVFRESKMQVENAYREEGFLWIRLEEEQNFRGDTVDVTFSVTEGRAAVVRRVSVEGNEKTRDQVVRREVKLMPGDKYRQSLMHRSVREIMQLNYFDNVVPDVNPNPDGTIDLVFDVEEKDNIGQLSVGAAYSERDGLVGTFSTSIPNFRGTGQQLDLNLEYSRENRQTLSIGFTEPWAFERPISLSGQIFYEKFRPFRTDSSITSYGFRVGSGHRLKWPDDYFGLRTRYLFSYQDDTWSGQHQNLVIPKKGIMSRLSLTLFRNDTDIPTFPTRGSIFSITPEIAGLGGDYRYVKSTVSYDYFFALPLNFVLGSKSKFGHIQKLGDELIISSLDLFDAGGVFADGQLRGYGESSFGGRYNPRYGTSMLLFSTELRYPLLEQQLYAGVFADLGNTWDDLSKVDLTDLKRGVGFGMRIMVPMLGLMGFDFAWGLDPATNDPLDLEPNGFEFHFIMNQGF